MTSSDVTNAIYIILDDIELKHSPVYSKYLLGAIVSFSIIWYIDYQINAKVFSVVCNLMFGKSEKCFSSITGYIVWNIHLCIQSTCFRLILESLDTLIIKKRQKCPASSVYQCKGNQRSAFLLLKVTFLWSIHLSIQGTCLDWLSVLLFSHTLIIK